MWDLARQRERKNVLGRGKYMCLRPQQAGGRGQGTWLKDTINQGGWSI